jgi:alcohol dehydrogenase class IV
VLGRDKTRHAACIDALESAGSNCSLFSVAGEPSVAIAREGAALARGADVVIGIGGGSVLDTAKAIAALAANPGDVLDYLEVVGRGEPLVNDPLPCIAVPTTSGTGSEVTRNAVLAADGVKASLRHVGMLPKVAIVDPDLAVGLPAPITASTGLDAITQLIEPYVSRRANPMTDAIALEGLRLAVRALRRAYRDPRDREARAGMACAATMSGMALANAGLGVVHGFAAPIGGAFPAPHGAVCAALLAHGMRANILAAEGTVLQRYAVVARILTGDADATPDDGVLAVSRMVGEMAIPGLAAYGIRDRDLDGLCERAARASSMKANPVDLSLAQLREVLERAL